MFPATGARSPRRRVRPWWLRPNFGTCLRACAQAGPSASRNAAPCAHLSQDIWQSPSIHSTTEGSLYSSAKSRFRKFDLCFKTTMPVIEHARKYRKTCMSGGAGIIGWGRTTRTEKDLSMFHKVGVPRVSVPSRSSRDMRTSGAFWRWFLVSLRCIVLNRGRLSFLDRCWDLYRNRLALGAPFCVILPTSLARCAWPRS